MKSPYATAAASVALLKTGGAFAQNGTMMNGTGADGWMNGYGWMGGYGGIWLPTLLAIAVIGVLVWNVMQKRK